MRIVEPYPPSAFSAPHWRAPDDEAPPATEPPPPVQVRPALPADVLAIRSHNEELERGLRARESELEALRLENGALANRERQNWFVVGAAVLTGGIVLGLVLPSLRRRRREW